MKLILWDFDRTLAVREEGWSGAMLEVLRRHCPDLTVTRDDLKPHIRSGFPWHTPDVPHTHIRSAEDWWAQLEPPFANAFERVGVASGDTDRLAAEVRRVYLNIEGWRVFDDALPVLSELASQDWTHRVLSNHVPELETLVAGLNLAPLIESVHSSANIGYEKPHPRAFEAALGNVPDGAVVWMVGDSVSADVQGAQAVGIPAILVRGQSDQAEHCCDDLTGVPDIVNDR